MGFGGPCREVDTIATEIGTAYLSIVAGMRGVTADIRKAYDGAESEGQKSGQKSGSGFVGGITKTIAKTAAIVGVGALVGKGISAGMSRAISIEASKKKLEGLGHSAASITSIMGSALASVKGTAYGLGDAASVAAMMSAAGVKNGKDLTRVLSTVADVAAISGRSLTDIGTIFGSVAAKGKLQGDDMLQLMSSGIPVLQLLSKQLGVSTADVSEMVSKGKIDFATFASAMQAGMGGAALKSGETFTGAVANVWAAVGRLSAAFLAPGLSAAKPILAGITDAVDAMTTKAAPLATIMASKLQPAAEGVGKALSALAGGKSLSEILGDVAPIAAVATAMSPLGLALTALQPVLPQIATAFGQVVAALLPAVPVLASVAAQLGGSLAQAAGAVIPALLPIVVAVAELTGALLSNETVLKVALAAFLGWKAIQGISAGITAFTTAIAAVKDVMAGSTVATGIATAAQWAWNAALTANPIGLIVAAIAAVVAALVWFFTQTEVGKQVWSAFTGWLVGAWNTISSTATTAFGGLAAFFAGLWTSITTGASAAWAQFIAIIQQAWAIIGPIVTLPLQIWGTLFQATFDTIVAVISAAFLIIVGLFTGNFDLIGQATSALGSRLQAIWGGAWASITSAVSNALSGVLGIVMSVGASIAGAASAAWAAVSGAFMSGVMAAVGFAAALPGRVAAAITALPGLITGIARTAWTQFTGAVTAGIANVVGFVRALPGKVVSALGNIGGLLVSAGRNMIQGFINGVQEMAGRIADAARAVIDGAIRAAKNALGIRSPSRVFMEIAAYTGEGFTLGLEAEQGAVAKAGAAFAAAAIPDVTKLDPWDQALADLRNRVTATQAPYEPPAALRDTLPVAPDRDEALAAAIETAVRSGLDGARLELGHINRITQAVTAEVVAANRRG